MLGAEHLTKLDDLSSRPVDIQEAENVFNELSRTLSGPQDDAASCGTDKVLDVEKGGLEDDDRFDLREYLQSSNDAHQRAGIKHKHVGVTWEDLQVEVLGGSDYKVRHIQ